RPAPARRTVPAPRRTARAAGRPRGSAAWRNARTAAPAPRSRRAGRRRCHRSPARRRATRSRPTGSCGRGRVRGVRGVRRSRRQPGADVRGVSTEFRGASQGVTSQVGHELAENFCKLFTRLQGVANVPLQPPQFRKLRDDGRPRARPAKEDTMWRIPPIGAPATVAVCAALALALTACGGDGGGSPEGAGTAELEGRGPITFVTGKDRSGNLQKQVDAWNAEHPDEQVRVIELPDEPNDQRQQMIQNATTKSDAYSVLNLDVVWTAEFAANRWLAELPMAPLSGGSGGSSHQAGKDEIDLSAMLPATIETGQYRGRLYAVPSTSDAGMLYYREDLLKKAGISEPPKTYQEMWDACDKVRKLPEGKDADCYFTEVNKTESMTISAVEAITSAGGSIIGPDGKPTLDTPQAKQGVEFLVNAKKDRMPKEAVTLDTEGGRRHFQSG